jgi:hypothetical protein
MSINQKILQLKEDGQDFEFYPTTNEILNAVNADIVSMAQGDDFNFRYGHKDTFIARENDDWKEGTHKIIIPSFIDIGSGDGRVFDFMRGSEKERINIKQRLGIEIADAQADDLIRRGIGIIGRDFFDTVLIDKEFNVCFSNPPYSRFKEWCNKICAEVRATLIYLVIPQRWQDDGEFAAMLKNKGELTVLGSYDFLEADRAARAKVDLIRIYSEQCRNQEDLFTKWVEQHIGKFEVAEEVEAVEEKTKNTSGLKQANGDTVAELCNNYREDMQELMAAYLSLAKIDFKLLQQLGIDKNSVIVKIKADIEGLKKRYWLKTFDILSPINSRLTWRTREKLLDEINWFQKLDYTEGNIKTIIVWTIENYNKYVKEQLLQAFDDFTGSDGFQAYKSNTVWKQGTWRYNGKDMPEKYLLDYRIITRCHISEWEHNRNQCILSDLAVIACNLGFDNDGVTDFKQDGKQKRCIGKDGLNVFEYRLYKNGNLHIKARKEFMQAWNLEVGRLKNWLHEPADVAKEFDISIEEAGNLWNRGNLQLIGKNSPLLLEFIGE